jgi:DNA-binding PadR family transcriptional regulator
MFGDRVFRGERFFHGFRHESPFQKGDLKYVILDLLKEKPRYGYEIIRSLEEQSHGFYKPSPGVVYPTLQMLEEMGYAKSTERDGKKVYEITEEGRQFLSERKDFADEVVSHMSHHWNFKNLAKMAMVMKDLHALESLLGRHFRQANPEQIKRIREVMAHAYSEIETILGE